MAWNSPTTYNKKRPRFPATPSGPQPDTFGNTQPAQNQPDPQPQPSPPPPSDPHDATYYANVAKLEFQKNNAIQNLNTQGGYDVTDTAEALRRLSTQHPKDIGTTRSNANRQGLLYSSTLGNRLNDVETNYQRRVSDTNLQAGRRDTARQTARAALEQGYPLDVAAELAAGADRASGRDATAAQSFALAANPTPSVPDFTIEDLLRALRGY